MSLKNYIRRGLQYAIHGVPTQHTTANITYTSPNQVLSNKKIIITGGGRGIGLAMARKFVSEGASVLIAGRNEDTLKASAAEIGCQYLKLDVQDTSSFNVFVDKADKMLGGANCLVNNAGISLHEKTFMDVTPESFDVQINTNFKGVFFLTQKFIQLLLNNDREGEVLFMSSETSHTADIRPYGLIKASINSLVKGLAASYASKGIRINAVAPGITASDMTGFKTDGNLYWKTNATKRIYLPEEVAECACFLLADVSGCISGEILTCNNGKTINTRW